MKQKKDYLFKHKQQSNRKLTLNDKYGALSAEELLIEYYADHPEQFKKPRQTDRFTRMFKRFD